MKEPTLKIPHGWVQVAALVVLSIQTRAQVVDHTPASSKDAVVHIVVHDDRGPLPSIPATIFGSFLEPIGRSTYGGIWAELLRKRKSGGRSMERREISRPWCGNGPSLEGGSQLGLPLRMGAPGFQPGQPLHEPRWETR